MSEKSIDKTKTNKPKVKTKISVKDKINKLTTEIESIKKNQRRLKAVLQVLVTLLAMDTIDNKKVLNIFSGMENIDDEDLTEKTELNETVYEIEE